MKMARSASSTSISVPDAIQQIIDSAQGVREYKPECEAICQRLVRLKRKLRGSNDQLRHDLGAVNFEKTFNGLVRALTTTKNLIHQCQNPHALQGARKLTATRAFERELDRMKYVLTGFEADLTVDSQEKKEILASAINEKQTVVRDRRDAQNSERARLILEMIGEETKVTAKEVLLELHKDYKEIVDHYSNKCDRILTGIPVIGLEGCTENFVKKVYHLESWQSSDKNRTALQDTKLPLNSVYIHLQADHSTTFEREQARKLVYKGGERGENEKSEYDQELLVKLASAPTMEFLNERGQIDKKTDDDEKASFQDILQNNRWIVILGDPGSGKTTFVRWLASRYIDAIKKDEPTVSSNFSNKKQTTDTTTKKNDSNESFVIGPSRMPILIRVGEFVEALKKKKRKRKIYYSSIISGTIHGWEIPCLISLIMETKKSAKLKNSYCNQYYTNIF